MVTAKGASSSKSVVVNPAFKWAVLINCVICIVTMTTMIVAVFAPQSELSTRLFTTCEKVFTLTAGAFIGLLGGKASGPG